MSKNNNFQFLSLFTIEMVVLSVFWQNKGLGLLEVKVNDFASQMEKYSSKSLKS